ncbi:MAG TPA: YdcF family protein [Prosthecobacter sp.]|nr:YdcF family protein [Prosthecobacter sp.]
MIDTVLRKSLMLAHPVGIVWLLLTLWLVVALFSRRRLAILPTLAWIILSLTTCTPLASWLLADLEEQFPPIKIESLPSADAILCLGGGAEPSFTEPTGVHLKRGADRVPTALLVAAQNKAGTLVLGGGGYPQDGKSHSEADAITAHLQRQQASPIPIVSLGLCADTHDEAEKFAELARQRGWQRVLLVTSASHMPRASATFTKLGLRVTPVPCNYQSSFNRVGEVEWIHLPHDHNFEVFSTWFHELIGTWVYRSRGWL